MSGNETLTRSEGIFALSKSIVGASLVFFPNIMANLGLIVGPLTIILIMSINVYSLSILASCSRQTSSKTYPDLAGCAFGPVGIHGSTFLLFTSCLIPLIFYLDLTTKYFYQFAIFAGCTATSVLSIAIRCFLSALCVCLCVFFRDVSALKNVSIVGLGCLAVFTGYTLYSMFLGGLQFDTSLLETQKGAGSSLSVVLFAFCSQFGIISITSMIENKKTASQVILASNLISGGIYILTGVSGFLANPKVSMEYFGDTEKNLFPNILKLSLGLVNLTTFPLIMVVCRSSAFYFLKMGHKKILRSQSELKCSSKLDAIVSLLITVCAFCISLTITEKNILDPIFMLTGSLVMFGLPAAIYYKIKRKSIRKIDYFMLATCALLTIFGCALGFKKLFHYFFD